MTVWSKGGLYEWGDDKMYKVTLIPGDGIWPEVTSAMVKVVEASGADIDWEIVEAGEALIEKYNTAIPDYVIDSIKKK